MAKIAKIIIETDGELQDGKLTISLKEAKELQKLLNELLEQEVRIVKEKEYIPYYPYTYPRWEYVPYTITYSGTNSDGETFSGSHSVGDTVSIYCSKN